MKRKRQSKDSAEPSLWSAESADRFLEHGRWLADWQWRRADAYERKASQLVGFSAVVVALLPTLIDPISRIENIGARDRAQATFGAVTVLLLASVGCGLAVLRRRSVSGFAFDRLQRHWKEYREKGKRPAHVTAAYVDVLLIPMDGNDPVLQSLSEDAKDRGTWFQNSCILLGLGILMLGLLLLQLLQGRG